MRRLAAALAWLILAAGAAYADDLAEAERLYAEGAFDKSAEIARAVGSADGHALAARSMLVDAAYLAPREEKLLLFERAADEARKALELEPRHVDANLQLAVALGQVAELQDPLTAHLNGYVRAGRAHLERALRLAPESAWAHGIAGIWHLQVVRHAGAHLALELYGARERTGVEHCAKAEALAPESIILRFGCAVSRLELDANTYGHEAMRTLALIAALPARDAAERLVQQRAARVMAPRRRCRTAVRRRAIAASSAGEHDRRGRAPSAPP